MKKVLRGSSFVFLTSLFLTTLFSKCGSSSASSEGEKIYITKCARCHGKDGKKGRKGAKDLTVSSKSLAYRINQLKEGKGKMPSFSERLSEEQIRLVAEYTMSTFPTDSLKTKN